MPDCLGCEKGGASCVAFFCVAWAGGFVARVCFVEAVGRFVGRPSAGLGGWRAPTIAVRSLRSGLPRCHPRPPAAPFGFPRAHQGRAPSARPRRRAGAVLVRCAAGSLFTGEICVARLTRPRGRPHSAYASAERRGGGRLRARGEVIFALRATRHPRPQDTVEAPRGRPRGRPGASPARSSITPDTGLEP